ncbi:MAG TPA: histidinol dehydrogenase [Polyangiaceae bacterium]
MSSLFREARSRAADFAAVVQELCRRGETDLERVEPAVQRIVKDVRREGDAALRRYIAEFEQRAPEQLLKADYGGAEALAALSSDVRDALIFAADRIRRYHERQAESLTGFEYEEHGVQLGSRVSPLAHVGVYAPGGKARYPSSVLMSVIPARVAGVERITLASPDPGVEVRAACHLAGVSALLDAGGAHAIAALAYGTESVARVDKIVGPGNIYVAAAKRLVFGEVAIDSIAGPSEILVVADDSANPAIIAADLLSQAEHDEAAYALLLCTSPRLVGAVREQLEVQLAALPRKQVAEKSLREHGQALVVSSRDELCRVANQLAVEHVSIQCEGARELADRITRAGALFIGSATPEAAGDYVAGPSHVLPTGGAARYGAPLGVYDFVSRSSLISYDWDALAAQAAPITTLARCEGLEAHARAVDVRLASRRDGT